jgi:hypothetical protein
MRRQADLISPAYLELQRQLHAAPRGYGAKGAKWRDVVEMIVMATQSSSVLDYGCGQGSLALALRAKLPPVIRVDEYDPAIAGKNGPPSFADLVVCTDVLEHIEPERLDAVLEHLRLLARKAVFVVIATRPASKTLADGRNAHLIIEDGDWWAARVQAAGFTIDDALTPLVRSPLAKPSREWIGVLRP